MLKPRNGSKLILKQGMLFCNSLCKTRNQKLLKLNLRKKMGKWRITLWTLIKKRWLLKVGNFLSSFYRPYKFIKVQPLLKELLPSTKNTQKLLLNILSSELTLKLGKVKEEVPWWECTVKSSKTIIELQRYKNIQTSSEV